MNYPPFSDSVFIYWIRFYIDLRKYLLDILLITYFLYNTRGCLCKRCNAMLQCKVYLNNLPFVVFMFYHGDVNVLPSLLAVRYYVICPREQSVLGVGINFLVLSIWDIFTIGSCSDVLPDLLYIFPQIWVKERWKWNQMASYLHISQCNLTRSPRHFSS